MRVLRAMIQRAASSCTAWQVSLVVRPQGLELGRASADLLDACMLRFASSGLGAAGVFGGSPARMGNKTGILLAYLDLFARHYQSTYRFTIIEPRGSITQIGFLAVMDGLTLSMCAGNPPNAVLDT